YYFCTYFEARGRNVFIEPYNYVSTQVHQREEHTLVDFAVGRDVGLGDFGGGGPKSQLGLGLRYAQLESQTHVETYGIPDWYVPHENANKYMHATHHLYNADLTARRSFDGAGPVLSWEASKRLIGADETGHADLDWTVAGGALFGKQKAGFRG